MVKYKLIIPYHATKNQKYNWERNFKFTGNSISNKQNPAITGAIKKRVLIENCNKCTNNKDNNISLSSLPIPSHPSISAKTFRFGHSAINDLNM